MVKGYVEDLTDYEFELWLTEYMNNCVVISDEEAGNVYNDADSAIAIQMSTPDGVENARLVLKKAFEYRNHIILED